MRWWRPSCMTTAYLCTLSVYCLCSPGNVVMIKSRLALKKVEAAVRIVMALTIPVRHQKECSSTPVMVVCTRPGPSNLILTPVWRVRALFLCPSTTRKFFVCLPYFVNRRDPAHTSTSFFLPDSQPLSGLFKAKRWGGLKASLSKPHPKVWEGLSHPNHSSWLPEPKLLRPRRGMWSVGTDWGHLLWGCVGHVSLWHSLCLLERRK
jgi:hypothetical protein